MRRLFFTIFLWFWLTLFGVAVIFTAVVLHAGFGYRSMMRLAFHDVLLFSFAGAIFCYLVIRYLTKPLNQLSEAAASIAEGRIETRVDPSLRVRRDEIADLACNFDRMAERIEALITGQRRLLSDVSHELRSPLSRLTVALGLVKQGPAAEAAENLERIGLEARRLDTLIGQLLTLTRIDSGVDRGAAAQFDLANLVQEVANDADFEARARNRSVVIERAARCMVKGFEELLRSAIENVARNAIRHRRRNRRPDFTSSPQFAGIASSAGLRTGSAGNYAVRNFLTLPPDRQWRLRRSRFGTRYCRTRRSCSSRNNPRDERE